MLQELLGPETLGMKRENEGRREENFTEQLGSTEEERWMR